jgi:hypothetical protein
MNLREIALKWAGKMTAQTSSEPRALIFRFPSRLLRRKAIHETGLGVLASLLLHLLAALTVFWLLLQTSHVPRGAQHVVPVDVVVRLADETRSPPSQNAAPVPQQASRRPEVKQTTAPRPPQGMAPNKARPAPLDDLDAKLRGLSRLRQTKSDLPVLDNAISPSDSTSSDAAPGNDATYGVRDYIRAQAERRWNLDFTKLGRRRFIIPIHVVMGQDGTILTADIVDTQRYASDSVYRSIALSARNALLLSSPIVLPAGTYNSTVEMTLDFNPRDMLR